MLLGGNWVDLVIILILSFFLWEAYRIGFWVILVDFMSFLFSLILSLLAYHLASNLLQTIFSLGRSTANAIGFLLMAILSEAALGTIFARLLHKLPDKYKNHKWVKPAAIIPAIGETVVLLAFFLTLIVSFPVSPKIKGDISTSKIGGFLVRGTSGFETKMSGVFGGIIEDSLTHLTVKPESREIIPLTTEVGDLKEDESSEMKMVEMVNEERRNAGLLEFSVREELIPVARDHARDMWTRKYFGHISPDNKDVGDRLDESKVPFTVAGENLALSPNTTIAHSGLMNSEGHRANILSSEFRTIGIGVIDNGYYGKMFVQIFSD